MGPQDLSLAYKHNMKYDMSNTFRHFKQEFQHMFSKGNYLTEAQSD